MLPASLRRAMGLHTGDRFVIRRAGDRVELELETPELEMEIAADGLPILVGTDPGDRLTNDDVVARIHGSREERLDDLTTHPR